MKRLLVLLLVWTLLVVTGTLVSANGRTRIKDQSKLSAINLQLIIPTNCIEHNGGISDGIR